MDVVAVIQGFRAEVEEIKQAIACLEQLRDGRKSTQIASLKVRDPRGRKSMSPAERQEVSVRMRKYWASLRERRNG